MWGDSSFTRDQLRAIERCKRLGHLPCPPLEGGETWCDRCGLKLPLVLEVLSDADGVTVQVGESPARNNQHGGAREGAGAPKGNLNALKHGQWSANRDGIVKKFIEEDWRPQR